jgi:GTP-binding protein EngB required for normal cell division
VISVANEILLNLDKEYAAIEGTMEKALEFLEQYRKIDSSLFWSDSERKLTEFRAAVKSGKKNHELVAYLHEIETNFSSILGHIDKIEHQAQDMYNKIAKAAKDVPSQKQALEFLKKTEPSDGIDMLYERAKRIEASTGVLIPKLEAFNIAAPKFLGRFRTLKSYADAMK